jgi:Phosphoribosyl transferase domain
MGGAAPVNADNCHGPCRPRFLLEVRHAGLDLRAPWVGGGSAKEPAIGLGPNSAKSYLPDLIVRHTTATKSQTARLQQRAIDHRNQLETIHLTKNPLRGDSGKRYSGKALRSGKTVLVLDDICTEGFSLDAAWCFIQQAGAKAILVAWLKTPNRSYHRLDLQDRFDPFKPQEFRSIPQAVAYGYRQHVIDRGAPGVIAKCLAAYKRWDWPAGVR